MLTLCTWAKIYSVLKIIKSGSRLNLVCGEIILNSVNLLKSLEVESIYQTKQAILKDKN